VERRGPTKRLGRHCLIPAYRAEDRARTVDWIRSAIATVHATSMIHAGGPKFLLLSSLLYAPGTLLFFIARRERKEAVFRPVENDHIWCSRGRRSDWHMRARSRHDFDPTASHPGVDKDIDTQPPNMEASMYTRLVCRALIAGTLAAIAPPRLSVAQSNDQGGSARENVAPRTTPHKHRHWRHLGGRHPHYGSRRVRTHVPDNSGRQPAN
jgi:hypothetical protein